MNPFITSRFAFAITATLLLMSPASPLQADDGASSIAAGGIVMVREPRIAMQKEVLKISTSKVQVDYEFRNDTDADITTQVAFPVPAYSLESEHYPPIKFQGFEDFRLTVEGKEIRYSVEVRAKLKGRDVSSVLQRYRIDIPSFGRLDEEKLTAPDIHRLPTAQRDKLMRAGLLDKDDPEAWPLWSVEKKYYWQQNFPARSVIHISHQYTPVLGNSNTIGFPYEYNPNDPKDAEFAGLCPTPALINVLKRIKVADGPVASMSYVDFILTTANTWKTPIEDFTLIVERPKSTRSESKENYVSFCWDGPVTKIDADHFSAHLINFVPHKELEVGFVTPY